MIITISGEPGSGKTSIAKAIAGQLGYEYHSVGEIMDEIAARRNITLSELMQNAKTDPSIDEEADGRQKKFAEKDNLVIDGRMGFFFIPKSMKILLLVDQMRAAERIFMQKRPEEKENISLKETYNRVVDRRQSEIERYRKYYGVDVYDKKNFDLAIDTTNKSMQEVLEEISSFLKKR